MIRPVLRKSLCSLGVVILLAAGACQRSRRPAVAENESVDRPGFGGDFSLTNQDGATFRLQDVRNRPALLFFGYTSCPDMCPMTMSRIMSARDRLGEQGAQLVTLFVSVDPKRDTPAVLKEYVGSFSMPVIGLTGTDDEVARVAAAYHASYQTVPTGSPNYLVNHTSAIFLIDRQGHLRQYFAYDEDPARLASAVQAVLNEK